MKRNGVGVSAIVTVGSKVADGVSVGGDINAVFVAAAFAVCAIDILAEFGSKVGRIGGDAGTSSGMAHANTSAVVIKKESFL